MATLGVPRRIHIDFMVSYLFVSSHYRGKSLNLNEVLDILCQEDQGGDVFIEPPDVQELTDKDSGDEEDEKHRGPENLSGNQLLAPAEYRHGNFNEETSDEEDVAPPAKKRGKGGRGKGKQKAKWTNSEEFLRGLPFFPESDYKKYRDFTPVMLFELFFDDDLIDYIVEQSRLYCLSNNWTDAKITSKELRVFIAILIVSGYNILPSKALYWSSSPDMRNKAVCDAMRRDRFDVIMKCLHFLPNNELDKTDKYSKLRPLITSLQKKFMLHFIPTQNISHDEAMIEYFGKHGCKQAIRNKPIRFGYKVWCQNTDYGYLIAFDLYQGKTFNGNPQVESSFGKCASTVLHLIGQYSDGKKNLPYHFFFDNLFTTLPLLAELRKSGYGGTGTVRSNRLGGDCTLMNTNMVDKKERGFNITVTCKIDNENILLTRWKDNATVTVASTVNGTQPIGKCQRWSKAEAKKKTIQIPHVIQAYNRNMGGTDLMNQNVNAYRIGIRGKKWWWSIFTWLLDVSLQNAWLLYRKKGSSITQREFRREIAMSYLLRYQCLPKAPGRKSLNLPGTHDMRYDGKDHFVQKVPDNKKRRCAGDSCKSIGRTECKKCNVGLCVDCFASYHT